MNNPNNFKLSGRVLGSLDGVALPLTLGTGVCPNTNLPFSVQSNSTLQNMSPEEYAVTRPYINPFFMHSGDQCQPTIKEEGPFAIQGNVGALIERAPSGFLGNGIGKVGGVVNRSAKSKKALLNGTAGVKNPEIYGATSLGLSSKRARDFNDNIHTVACDGTRTANAGQTSTLGCGEWTPNQVNRNGMCTLKNFL